MRARAFIIHLGILAYLLLTFVALLYTLFRIEVPVLWPFAHFSYGMMAPYQGHEEWNGDLRAWGRLPGGAWESIDLDPYYPFLRGEAVIRRRFVTSPLSLSPDVRQAGYARLANELLREEREAGRAYDRVRLSWEEWPLSGVSFGDLRRPPFIRSFPIVETP